MEGPSIQERELQELHPSLKRYWDYKNNCEKKCWCLVIHTAAGVLLFYALQTVSPIDQDSLDFDFCTAKNKSLEKFIRYLMIAYFIIGGMFFFSAASDGWIAFSFTEKSYRRFVSNSFAICNGIVLFLSTLFQLAIFIYGHLIIQDSYDRCKEYWPLGFMLCGAYVVLFWTVFGLTLLALTCFMCMKVLGRAIK